MYIYVHAFAKRRAVNFVAFPLGMGDSLWTLSCEKSINFDTQRFCGIYGYASSSHWRLHGAQWHTLIDPHVCRIIYLYGMASNARKYTAARTHQTRKWQIEAHVLWRRIITRPVWRVQRNRGHNRSIYSIPMPICCLYNSLKVRPPHTTYTGPIDWHHWFVCLRERDWLLGCSQY